MIVSSLFGRSICFVASGEREKNENYMIEMKNGFNDLEQENT